MVRRLTAVLLMLSLALFTAETLIADVHDGDAGGGETHVENADAPVHAPKAPDAPARGDGHDVHVCHCVHPHGGVPVFQAPLPMSFLGPQIVTARSDERPNDVGIAPPLRPPIG